MSEGEMRTCGGCGGPFLGKGREAFCVPCELAIQAAEPPAVLVDMRHVYGGRPAQTEGQKALARVLHEDPKEFLGQMRRAEAEYRAHLRAREEQRGKQAPEVVTRPATEQGGSVEEDAGRERVLELLEAEWERVQKATQGEV